MYCNWVETLKPNGKGSPNRLGNYLAALLFKSHRKKSLGINILLGLLHTPCMTTTILPHAVKNSHAGKEINSPQPIDSIACSAVWTWHGYCSLEYAQPSGGDV